MKDNAEGITGIEWTVYGKIKQIKKGAVTINYTYDVSENRISKEVIGAPGGTTKQFYIRDAQGNTMAIYNGKTSYVEWAEQHLYGSSRLGTWNYGKANPAVPGAVSYDSMMVGSFNYELTNHLGNVLSTISDKKVGVSAGGVTVDYYNAEVLGQNDYYAFGMMMPGRKYSIANTNYRYGFNGKENDKEVKGEGNQQDYGMRIYDPLLGRFLSTDPIASKYPELTPYQFASNSPISGIDQDGLEYVFYKMIRNNATSEFKIVKTGELDYGNWALNLAHKTTGWTPDYFKTPVLEYLDGNHYLFSSEEEVMRLKPGDARLSPKSTYTLEGIGSLYNLTDAMAGVMVGSLVKKMPSESVSQNRGRGVAFEKPNNSAAQAYENTATGISSNVTNQKRIIQTLKYDNPNPNGKNYIKFDGFETETNTFIDRKLSITSFPKALDQARRASEALRQNPGFKLRYEVPDGKQLKKAIKIFRDLKITNISVKIVPKT